MATRRDFISSATAFGSLLLTDPLSAFHPVNTPAHGPDARWWERMRRCAQHNLNEYDPAILDIDSWVDYWASLKVNAVVLTAGGFIAMYPTKLPHHHKSQFLGNRDLFGDYLKALKKKDIRVIARIETNFLHRDIFREKPEWFERNADGSPRAHSETPWVYRTCLFSPYRNEQVPKIIDEINSLYDVDAFFTNSWPQVENVPHLCDCDNCKKLGDLSQQEIVDKSMERTRETIGLINAAVKRKSPNVVYNVNIAGGIGAVQDLQPVADLAEWITTDHQGRGGNTAMWDCAQQGKVAYAVMRGKPVTNVVGVKTGPWRHSSNAAAETTMWMAQTSASGMIPWIVCLGSELPDPRWQAIGQSYYQWLAKNEKHFFNRRSMARVGLVFSQRTNQLYKAPGKVAGGYYGEAANPKDHGNPTDYFQGMYYALLEGRVIFDLIHEDDLAGGDLGRYNLIILPNIAVLSDAQAAGIRQYAAKGGSVLATFETGFFDESGKRRNAAVLGDLFDFRLPDGYRGPKGQVFYTTLEQPQHPILQDFKELKRLPGGEYYVPVQATGGHVMDIFPPFPNGIPEMVYYQPRAEMNNEGQPTGLPALIVREKGNGRLAYFPTDIDKNTWTSGSADLSKLLQRTVEWLLNGKAGIAVEGKGDVEVFAWETEPGFAVHILNYNNPNMTKSSNRRLYPIGEQRIHLELPKGVTISRASLLRAGRELPFKQDGSRIECVVPSVVDVEVAVFYRNENAAK
jgi:hypothetical protein